VDKPEERAQIKEVVLKLIESVEAEMLPRELGNDGSAALALAIQTLCTISGKESDDSAFPELVGRIKATMDIPQVRNASDLHKQELYERCMCAVGYMLVLGQAGESAEVRSKLKEISDALLQSLIGVDSSRITIGNNKFRLDPLPKPVTPIAEVKTMGGMAPGFTFSAPAGWTKRESWYGFDLVEQESVRTISGALMRFPAAIPATGNMGEALSKLWLTEIPVEGKDQRSPMVYRRYVGDQLLGQFIFGQVREAGRESDTGYTLMLVDCKTHWQPIVIALTFEGESIGGLNRSAIQSFSKSMKIAEDFLATLRCPSAKAANIADITSLAGDYKYNRTATLKTQSTYGRNATFMTLSNSTGGVLSLKPNGTFNWTLSSANGVDTVATYRGAKGSGRWTVDGDILTCNFQEYDQGDGYKVKQHQYRIAGLTNFADGVKVAVLLSDLEAPVNMTTVGSSSNWYSSKTTK